MTGHDDWLNLVTEMALEPELPICDAQHHIKNLEGQRYLAADFIKDASGGHNIKQTIVVQNSSNLEPGPGGGMFPVDETIFVMKQIANIKSKIDIAAGFVGYADLATGKAVQTVLEAHLEAGKKRFKGIRYPSGQPNVLNESSILCDSRFREGFAFLSKYKLTYELSIGMSQFPELVDLAKKHPDTPIIVNHLGLSASRAKNPEEKDEMKVEWRRSIQMIAPITNIYMKLGGSGVPNRGFGFDKKPRPPTSEEMVQVVGDYYRFVIEQFGPKRCMFESNFPADKASSSYNVIWNAFKLVTKSFTKTDRSHMFQGTANQVYRL
jgi:L-fuconolactonase